MNPRFFRLTSVLIIVAVVVLSLAAVAGDYGDTRFERKAAGMDDLPSAVFPHWIHRMQYKCSACHDKLFKMKAGANLVNMDELQAGKWCGVCHDGKTAFISDLNSCTRCHYK